MRLTASRVVFYKQKEKEMEPPSPSFSARLMVCLRHCERPQSLRREQPRRAGHRRWLRPEKIMDGEPGRHRGVVPGVIGAQEPSREPVRANLIRQCPAQVVVGADTRHGGKRG